MAVPPAHPAQHEESGDFGRNFNGTINELGEVNTDAEAGNVEADPVVEEGNGKAASKTTQAVSPRGGVQVRVRGQG